MKKFSYVYLILVCVLMFTLTYVSVPLYKLFCQNFGLGGAVQVFDESKIALSPNLVTVNKYVNFWFNAQVHDKLPLVFHAEDLNLKV